MSVANQRQPPNPPGPDLPRRPFSRAIPFPSSSPKILPSPDRQTGTEVHPPPISVGVPYLGIGPSILPPPSRMGMARKEIGATPSRTFPLWTDVGPPQQDRPSQSFNGPFLLTRSLTERTTQARMGGKAATGPVVGGA